MKTGRRWAGVAAMMGAVMALGACGGGSSSPPPASTPAPAPAPALTLSAIAPDGVAVEGSGPVAIVLDGATGASGAVAWSLAPSIGALSQASARGAVYTPPAVGTLTAPTTVTIAATPANGSAATLRFTITLLPFGVSGTTPAAGGRVDIGVQPTIVFTRTLAATLPAAAVSLASPAAAVPAVVAASGATITVSPKAPLVWGGHYTVSMTGDVVSAVGQPLAPTSFSFDVAAPTWSVPAPLAPTAFSAGTPAVAFDHAGHAFAAWQQDTTNGTGVWNIQAARFDLATRAWSAPVALHAVPRMAAAPTLATDLAGNAIATWSEDTGNFNLNIFAARFDASQGAWGAAVPIQTVSGQTAQAPQVVMDAAGNGTVVWQQYTANGASLAIWSARFDAATSTWRPALQLDPGSGATNPHVALDAAGNAVAVWEQGSAGGVAQVAAARWSQLAGAWSAAQVLQASTLSGTNPQLAVAPDGSAMVVWSQTESNGSRTAQAVRSAGVTAAWGAPQALSPATGVSAADWTVAQADPGGNVIVVWQEYQSPGVFSRDARRYDASTGQWSSVAHIETLTLAFNIDPFGGPPALVVDAAGNATAAWTQEAGFTGDYHAFQARFDGHLGTWTAATALAGTDRIGAGGVLLAGDEQGDVLAGWNELDPANVGSTWWALLAGS